MVKDKLVYGAEPVYNHAGGPRYSSQSVESHPEDIQIMLLTI
jgi:hypothetical protein